MADNTLTVIFVLPRLFNYKDCLVHEVKCDLKSCSDLVKTTNSKCMNLRCFKKITVPSERITNINPSPACSQDQYPPSVFIDQTTYTDQAPYPPDLHRARSPYNFSHDQPTSSCFDNTIRCVCMCVCLCVYASGMCVFEWYLVLV